MSMDYETVIGLEVHVQLKTRTKAFCGCSTEFAQPANTQTCPVCLGFPGSLPVLNEKVLEYGMRVALALNCQVQNFTKFDRKNYFYPDLPKNYQISQFDLPLALKGFLDIKLKAGPKRIGLTRVHMEEDAGKLIHQDNNSLVDYNRSGIPLLEIVSEPDISSPEEAYQYLLALKAILKYIEVSDCDMEKGSLRCDANISLRQAGVKKLGTKTELKNMNSFKAVKDALSYEIERQKEILKTAGRIIQETLLWDEVNARTYAMRSKEEAMDYRYFPEPDLPPFVLSAERIKAIKDNLPELPEELKERFIRDYGLSSYDVGILAGEKPLADYFEACLRLYPQAKIISNWLIGALSYELNSRNSTIPTLGLSAGNLIELLKFVEEGKISNLRAKEVLTEMLNSQKTAAEIIREKGLSQVSAPAELKLVIEKVIRENLKSVQDYESGKINALMFLVGQVMRLSKGKANPKIAQELLKRRLDNV